jgi:hypothetical protein
MYILDIYVHTKIYYDLSEPSVNNHLQFATRASQIGVRAVCAIENISL